jgi:thiol-disulfide isomerase/thioredoxin
MKLRTCYFALLVGLLPLLAAAQDTGYRISGRIRGLKDTVVVLAYFQYDPTHYVPKDTARVDASGNFVFEGKKKLPEGQYLVVMPKQRIFELMLTEQQFGFETDTTDLIGKMITTGSVENAAFFGYQQKLKGLFEQLGKLDKEPKSEANQQKMKALQTEARTFRTEFIAKHPTLFTTKMLLAAADPEIPTPPKAANGRPDSLWQFNYYKNHYWDNFDLADDRMLRTGLFQPRLDRYIKDLTVQQVDSLTKEADMLVKRTKGNKETKNYVIWYLTSQYERPKVLGTDGLFIHMVEKYWLTGQVDNLDSTTRKTVSERVAILKPLQVGKPFRLPAVGDTLARPIDLLKATTGAEYTIVMYYAPHCGHCREAAPKIKKFTDSPAGKGVKMIAIAIEDSPDDWKKFIREFGLTSWIHGYDHTQTTDFRRQYDVFSTPTIYVLDKDRKIIARALPSESVEDFMGFTRKQAAAAKTNVPAASAKPAPKQQKGR